MGKVSPRQIAVYARTRTRWKENVGQPSANRCIRENTDLLEGKHGTGKVSPRQIIVHARTQTIW